MNNVTEIINSLMDKQGLRRKRDVAEYFGVSPQALSLWIAKDEIPPKHLLKLSQENIMINPSRSQQVPKSPKHKSSQETQTVIDYLMRENVELKNEIATLRQEINNLKTNSGKGDLIEKIQAESLIMSGRVSDGVITSIEGKWDEIMGYSNDELIGHRYDREDLIHPEEFNRTKRHQDTIKNSEGIKETRFSTIQRWKHGQTGDYVMLSMVWYVNVEDNRVDIVAKPIDAIMAMEDIMN